MDGYLWIRVLLAFTLAGSFIALLTLLAERFGSTVGGLIANLPSNILITMIFISLTQGNDFVHQMIPAIPVGLLINTFFLLTFILLLRLSLLTAIIGSLAVWFIMALLANSLGMTHLWLNAILYIVITFLVWLWTEHRAGIPDMGRSGKRYTPGQMTVRALFAGSIVGGVVAIAHFVPAYLTGIVSTFPAVLFSTVVILTVSQGSDFARATGKVMILSLTNILIFVITVYYSFPLIGVVGGTLVSVVLAVGWVKYVLQSVISMSCRKGDELGKAN
jgi:uncharacterized membrane protein (GlpM family)